MAGVEDTADEGLHVSVNTGLRKSTLLTENLDQWGNALERVPRKLTRFASASSDKSARHKKNPDDNVKGTLNVNEDEQTGLANLVANINEGFDGV